MKNLRNVVKRSTHKERHQPAARKHLGLLEKKKDYLVRAKNYHSKQDYLKSLEEKTRLKNPDEFSFAMLNGMVDPNSGKFRKLTSKAARIGHKGGSTSIRAEAKKAILGTAAAKLNAIGGDAKKMMNGKFKKLSKAEAIQKLHFEDLSKEEQLCILHARSTMSTLSDVFSQWKASMWRQGPVAGKAEHCFMSS